MVLQLFHIPECGEELAVGGEQNMYGWKTKGRFGSDFSMARALLGSVVLIIGSLFFFNAFLQYFLRSPHFLTL